MYKIISKDRLEKLAWLVKIKLEENEKEEFLNQLNKILEAFKIIDELSLENIEPTYHVMEIVNVFREDEVRPSLSQEEALSTAKKVKDGYFVAPKIF
ncbi:MAG: Asp-tRNA(Asn)/Glu-tRNA(Gln) amidotransferase GatCAB subunit C [Candidatus Methanomethylicota archaeon]|uniref:Aspartyl/glutamyl-tRNA(Asn/Gln) amidotransferase subunit C n=1 Tax=Thermoproteota archaeon TaxID=2056631 RepID=A0A520KH83_9CREN|nr:MAG: Asp-tRNA(Asn)/Glu-tRNA(Gln) amidotransferase subunit GatC [Candidatus Verstraetearchaeota archaeon]TDA38024.1 MAG: Asp-tRNA(Asn)/Glu-tRNA(Gln) amidotransferase GatCAB subunit C [Candidatus Verstraetearchaeota archaeon]